MDTFFAVTSHMMKNVGSSFGKMANGTILLIGSAVGFLIVLITVLFCNSSNKRSFINKNKKLIIIVFVVEMLFVWLCQNTAILKAGFILLLICGFVIALQSGSKVKKVNVKQRKPRTIKK